MRLSLRTNKCDWVTSCLLQLSYWTGNCGILCCRLNEGFTVFLERKILGRRKGAKMVDFAYTGKSKVAKWQVQGQPDQCVVHQKGQVVTWGSGDLFTLVEMSVIKINLVNIIRHAVQFFTEHEIKT